MESVNNKRSRRSQRGGAAVQAPAGGAHGAGGAGTHIQLNVTVAGTQLFERNTCDYCACEYRLCMDGTTPPLPSVPLVFSPTCCVGHAFSYPI
jgi:hypothetical protein